MIRTLLVLAVLFGLPCSTFAADDLCAEARRISRFRIVLSCEAAEIFIRESGTLRKARAAWLQTEMRNAGDYWNEIYHLYVATRDGSLAHFGEFPPENANAEMQVVSGLGIKLSHSGGWARVKSEFRSRFYDRIVENRDGEPCRVYLAKAPFIGEARECPSGQGWVTWEGPQNVDPRQHNYRVCLQLSEADQSLKCEVMKERRK
jgi:hypothetical protein